MRILGSLLHFPVKYLLFFLRCLDIIAVHVRPLEFIKKKSLALDLCLAFTLFSFAYAVGQKSLQTDCSKAMAYVMHWELRECLMGRHRILWRMKVHCLGKTGREQERTVALWMKELFKWWSSSVELATGWLSLWVRIREKASGCQKCVCYGAPSKVRNWMKISLSNLRKSSDHDAGSYGRLHSAW